MLSPVLCSHPVIIVNPAVYTQQLQSYVVYRPDGSWYGVLPCVDGRFKPFADLDLLECGKMYMVRRDGSHFHVFLALPCGHCALCAARKQRDLAFRFEAETAQYTSRPLFLTLTFDDAHIPCFIPSPVYDDYGNLVQDGFIIYGIPDWTPDSVSYYQTLDNSVVQKFFKRLRIRLTRTYHCRTDFRYFCVGEYGKNTKRPHYHLVLWNFPSASELGMTHADDSKYLKFVEDIIFNEWQQSANRHVGVLLEFAGQPRRKKGGFSPNIASSVGCAKYVAKYVYKEDSPKYSVYSRDNHTLQSVKPYGIGKKWIMDNAHHYYSCPKDFRCSVTNPFTLDKTSYVLPSYYRNYLFPNFQRHIGYKLSIVCKLFLYMHGRTQDVVTKTTHTMELYDILIRYMSRPDENEIALLDVPADVQGSYSSLHDFILPYEDELFERIAEYDWLQSIKRRRSEYADTLTLPMYDVDMLDSIQAQHFDYLSATDVF